MTVKKLVSIVTPCYNEEGNIFNHYTRVKKSIENFQNKYDFEHIYCDNCSEDKTFEFLSRLASEEPNVRVLRYSRNIGADRSIFFGLEHTKGDAAIVIQADLQDPPELLGEFIKRWEEGYDVVYGQILQREEGWLLKSLRRFYYYLVTRFSDVPIPQNAGEFRLTSRRALNALLQFQEADLYMRGAVAAVGFKQTPLQYHRKKREAGKSSVNFLYLVGYAINGLLSTTVVPIRLVTFLGFIVSSAGFLLTLVNIVIRLAFPQATPQGYTTLACLITFFSGVQVLSIGIIGEYLRKTYVQTLGRPRGFVQDKINFPS